MHFEAAEIRDFDCARVFGRFSSAFSVEEDAVLVENFIKSEAEDELFDRMVAPFRDLRIAFFRVRLVDDVSLFVVRCVTLLVVVAFVCNQPTVTIGTYDGSRHR